MKTQVIQLHGCDVHVDLYGEGTPLLIMHGWGSNAAAWQEVAELLSHQGYEVVVPDFPGFGRSSVPPYPFSVHEYHEIILSLMAELGYTKYHAIGHSFGGRIGLLLGSQEASPLKSLVLCAASGLRPKLTFKRALFYPVAKFGKGVFSLPGLSSLYTAARRMLYRLIGEGDYVNAGELEGTFKKVIAEDLGPLLSKIVVPTFIIWGENDLSTPLSFAHRMHSEIPNSELVIIPGAGHRFPYEDPNTFVREVLAYLEGGQK